MTRVLFLAESFFPVLGGGEKHIRDLSSALVRKGLGATVLTRRTRCEWPAEEQLDGVRVLRVAPSGPGRLGKYLMVAPLLARLRRERNTWDVAIVCGTRVLGLPGVLAAHALGKPVALQAEMTGEMTGEIYVWGTALHRPAALRLLAPALAVRNAVLRRAEAVVAISRLIEREMAFGGVRPERLAYIPHAVDTDRFRPVDATARLPLRLRLGLPADRLLVTYTGRLLKGKGLEVLVEAFARLAAEIPTAQLVVVGSGEGQTLSVEEALHVRTRELGLASRVIFTGRVENVEEYLGASDVFAFPSLYEGLPHSIVEAAAAGLPAAASRVGGIPDVVEDGVSGLLVEPGDVAGLADALRRLLRDAALRERQGAAGRLTAVERFSLSAVTQRYIALFEALAARRPPTALA